MSVNRMPCGDNLEYTSGYGKLSVTPIDPTKPGGEMWDNWSVPSEMSPEHVHIAEGVTRIGAEAFKDCSTIEDVWMPDSLEEIGEGAFAGCENLTEIYIPPKVDVIEEDAFRGSGLESVTIPKEVDIIKEGAFADCSSLTEVEVNATHIGANAFQNSGIEYLTVGNNVKTIGDEAFADNGIQEKVVLANVSSIGENVFYGTDAEIVASDNISAILKEEGIDARTPTLAEQIEMAKAEDAPSGTDEESKNTKIDLSDDFSL